MLSRIEKIMNYPIDHRKNYSIKLLHSISCKIYQLHSVLYNKYLCNDFFTKRISFHEKSKLKFGLQKVLGMKLNLRPSYILPHLNTFDKGVKTLKFIFKNIFYYPRY